MTEHDPITELSEDESWGLLASVALGRLVTAAEGNPEIFPVNFVAKRPTVLFKTAPGTKLISAILNRNVVFEADDHTLTEGWSVIVKGIARVLSRRADLEKAERAQLLSWIATDKPYYVAIEASQITGRRFSFGSEPDPAAAAPA
jgi:nitroimidazol reductase NimA-like FMN-containing flavoprotein (pyridoxamine 5'-phosphate oxidase superfamily)